MADETTTPWYLNLSTWINVVQGILGLLIAAGGAGVGADHLHVVDTGNIAAGLGVAGISVAHEVRRRARISDAAGLRPVAKSDIRHM